MERIRAVVAAGPDTVAAAADNTPLPLFEDAAAGDEKNKKQWKKRWGRKAASSSAPPSLYLEAAQRDVSFSSSLMGGFGGACGSSSSLASLQSRSPAPIVTAAAPGSASASASSPSSLARNASGGSISRIGSSGRILGVGERIKGVSRSAAPSPARPLRAVTRSSSNSSLLALSQASREELAAAAVAAGAAATTAGGIIGSLDRLSITTTPPSSSPPSPTRSVASSAAGFPSPEPVAVSFFGFFLQVHFRVERTKGKEEKRKEPHPLQFIDSFFFQFNRTACASSTRCFLTRRE
jgi:hypothetical protein